MRRLLALTCLLLLVGCQGGGGLARIAPTNGAPPASAGQPVELKLTAAADGAGWRIELSAPDARDLYQLAGTLTYPVQRYQVGLVEAGGGLGGPEDSYFVQGERTPGRLDFAYTKRFYGPGATGAAALLVVHVQSTGAFSLSDFSLDQDPGRLRVRDSRRRELQPRCTREGQS